MPLRQTRYGGECPLDKFEIDRASPGSYTSDPLEACLGCNFANLSSEEFNLAEVCQCPEDMTWDRYNNLRKEYAGTRQEGKPLTKRGFWEFVKPKEK